MEAVFRFKKLTAFIFCCYLLWAFFGIDLTINGSGAERLPLHRVFLLGTAFIFLFNLRVGVSGLLQNKLLIALVFYLLATALWAGDPKEVVKTFVFLILGLTISMMMAVAFRNDFINLTRLLFWSTFLMVMASVIMALVFPKYGVNATGFEKVRWIGITDHPNKLGGMVLLSIWSCVNLFVLTTKKFEKFLVFISAFISIITVIKADSMTSIVASLFVFCHMLYIKIFSRKSMSFKVVLFGLAGFVLAIVTTFYMSSRELVSQSLASTGRDVTLTGRSTLWEKGLESFAENPISGEGFDDLEHLTRKYHIRMSHLHNGYIEILVKGGWLLSCCCSRY
ncbi:O-antigen ligase family protein [Methylomonas sp. CM2]|uniref:O-antigen ligase family protein n=1 Tax=Methylomonas sp. CM2 TaxID=3417647 RepID=UPI003CEBC2C6